MRFNPRPTRGATSANNARAYTNVFQSTPPHEGRLTSRPAFVAVQCFNPRPHARGDTDRLAAKVYHAVSIHAPARGATKNTISDLR